jgi:L-ascorbate metabolism protein UlaG (beta-lactamase superfamily)
MGPVHMGPDQAVEAARDVGAQTSLAIHFAPFKLADDGEEEPVRDPEERSRGARGSTSRVLRFGQASDLAVEGP